MTIPFEGLSLIPTLALNLRYRKIVARGQLVPRLCPRLIEQVLFFLKLLALEQAMAQVGQLLQAAVALKPETQNRTSEAILGKQSTPLRLL